MKKILYSVCAIVLLSSTMMTAQQSRTSMTYAVGFATGDLGNFISQPSWRGFNVELLKMTSTKIGVGGSFGWNVFYQENDFDTYTKGTASLSGKQYRYSNNLPILANVDYYMNPGQKINT